MHLLPGTWPLLIPFLGSGAVPSNLQKPKELRSPQDKISLPNTELFSRAFAKKTWFGDWQIFVFKI